ncbi:hypothetical protein CKA32_004835 [Geitlerinema sp. FC II]|nr:hypothetical protein CKA32_004835 [Geitlerinema sp. FC II]
MFLGGFFIGHDSSRNSVRSSDIFAFRSLIETDSLGFPYYETVHI